VLLVPEAETAVAERVAAGRIRVIGVATLGEAIEELRGPSISPTRSTS
jgi:predicted S18 family serine protease